jgi:methylmalonyl-CoA mutase, N-terminal domain
MTDRIEAEAMEYIQRIDAIGGMVPAIESGYPQSEIQKASYRSTKSIEGGNRIIVGVNKYRMEEKELEGLLKIDRSIQDAQIKSLHAVRAERNQSDIKNRLMELKTAAEGTANLMPFILQSVRAYASVGEICSTLRSVFGEYREQTTI